MSKYPDAIWQPTSKNGYPSTNIHLGEGVVIHSAEGSYASAMAVLAGPREASWHFFVCKDGTVYQHVDSANIAWTNGSFEANKKFWGIETEGVAGEPLTDPQFESLALLVKWLLGPLPAIRGKTLWEHNEMTAYGAQPTACPSKRIPWTRLIAALEDDMDELAVKKLIELYLKHDSPLFRDQVNAVVTERVGLAGPNHKTLLAQANEHVTNHPAGGKHDHGVKATLTGRTEEN